MIVTAHLMRSRKSSLLNFTVMEKAYFQKRQRLKPSFLFSKLPFIFIGLGANANVYTFYHTLSGTLEAPPNSSPGTGIIAGWYDDVTNTLSYSIIFSNLSAPAVFGHLHAPAPTPNVAAPIMIPFTGFPANVTAGSYSQTVILTAQQEGWSMQTFTPLQYRAVR